MPRAICASAMACLVGPTSPAMSASGRLVDAAAKPHALERPLDLPAGAGQASQELGLLVNGVDQQRTGFGPNDLFDHRKSAIRAIRKQWADMPGCPPVADERHRVTVRQQPGTRTFAELGQQDVATKAQREAIPRGEFLKIAK